MNKKYSSGIIHIVPLLVIAGIFVLSLSFLKNPAPTVLSDTDQQEEIEAVEMEEEYEIEVENEDENEESSKERKESSDKGQGNLELNRERVETKTEVKLKVQEREMEYEYEDATTGAKTKVKVKNEGKFPLSINEETGELTVTTPAGIKTVTVLPDRAVDNLLRNKKIATQSAVQIVTNEESGEVEYEVDGYDEQKLLGIFDIKINKKFRVSAQTGEETEITSDLLTRLLDLISF